MGYVYKTYKTKSSFLKKDYQKKTLISMSVSLTTPNKIHPTYVLALGEILGDYQGLGFATFNSQNPLNEHLLDNPSGFYENLGYNKWATPLVNETYRVREFKVDNKDYAIIRIDSIGLTYNLLVGPSTMSPYILKKEKIKTKQDKYNVLELINLGLFGRTTKVSSYTQHSRQSNNISDELSTNIITNENGNTMKEIGNYSLAIFNESISPLFVNDALELDVELQANSISVSELLEGKDLEYDDPDKIVFRNLITLSSKYESIELLENAIM